ncbi:MAG: tail fiber domain-containing protein [Deltaproteobacteria bacterium]|nr:tail fiber domain-containing protein [Deltaproteobacteria bacterium]
MTRVFLFATLTIAMSASFATALADVPGVLVHQGYLTDKAGSPVNGGVGVVAGIYTSPTDDGGLPVWEEDLGEVLVTNGFYYAEIGKKITGLAGVFSAHGNLYLEIKVGGDKLSPRQLVGAVPYAQVCQDATGDIHAKSVSVGTTQVIDSAGKWVADPSNVPGVKSVGTAAPLSGGPITDSGTISLSKADAATSGYLSSTDWAAFNEKQNRVTGVCPAGTCAVSVDTNGTLISEAYSVGDISSILATAPLAGGGYAGDITLGLTKATAASDGYVSSADWSAFNAKQGLVTGTCNLGYSIRVINPDGTVQCEADDNAGGTVTNIATGTGLSGGPITGTGTVALAATYADGSAYDGRFVNTAGDNMTGALGLPADGLSVGTDQLVCKDGFVGFGTASPMSKIDIRNGGLRVAQGLGSAFYFEPLSTAALGIGVDPVNGNGVTVLNNGNVGIGTTNPSFRLHVSQNAPTIAYYGFQNTSPAGGRAVLFVSNNDLAGGDAYVRTDSREQSFTFGTLTNGDFAITGSSEVSDAFKRLVIQKATGRVGIGTTAPENTLHVQTTTEAVAAKATNLNTGSVDAYGVIGTSQGAKGGGYRNVGVYGYATGAPQNYSFLGEGGWLYNQGNVGIGVPQPQYQLHLSADSAAKPGTNTWTIDSDVRLKKDVKTLDGALDRMLRLRGVTFRWKEPEKQGNRTGVEMGMIAQEVEKVFPQWVGTNKDGMKDLTIGGFEALTVEAMRELKAENDALKAESREIRGELSVLRKTLSGKPPSSPGPAGGIGLAGTIWALAAVALAAVVARGFG